MYKIYWYQIVVAHVINIVFRTSVIVPDQKALTKIRTPKFRSHMIIIDAHN